MTISSTKAYIKPHRPLPSPTSIQLIVSDVDGTLLDSHHTLPPTNPTYQVLSRIRTEFPTLPIIISTGKQHPSTAELRRDLNLESFPSIHLNGNVTYAPNGGGVVRESRLTAATVRGVFKELRKDVTEDKEQEKALFAYDYDVVWQILGTEDDGWARVLRGYGEDVRVLEKEEEREAFVRGVESGERRIFKLAVCEEEAPLAVTRKRLETLFPESFAIVQALTFCIEMIPVGHNKGTALADLLKDYYKGEIKPENVIAFGDGENDVSMFKVAGMSLAMGNAMSRELMEEAVWVSDETNDDGAVGRFLGRVFWGHEKLEN
ncbi:HAD-like protein [Ascodesmis nigricans]|uniref:HAD-like protein n=1 Tax=Ascodesmis nigricans TaxID=341454 RepID=A0A4S2MZV8_9PEZI|nr:HAD-like protein [Ascodesmis nigricans]